MVRAGGFEDSQTEQAKHRDQSEVIPVRRLASGHVGRYGQPKLINTKQQDHPHRRAEPRSSYPSSLRRHPP
jgi:hypothetical protein